MNAAEKAGVQHIVHVGVFAEWDTTDAHFAWRQLIEKHIEASGIAWTHLYPNMFMEAFTFLAVQLRSLLAQAEIGQAVVSFTDATYLVHGCGSPKFDLSYRNGYFRRSVARTLGGKGREASSLSAK